MENAETESSRTSKVTRRTLAAGAVWTVPAVVMATPAQAVLSSGQRHYHISYSPTTNLGRTVTVTVTVHNGLAALTGERITITGFTFSNGTLDQSPLPSTTYSIPSGGSVFTFTLTGNNNGGNVVVGTPGATFAPTAIAKDAGPV